MLKCDRVFGHYAPENKLLETLTSTDAKRVWPGTILVFCGIDYLAKFYAGSDAERQVGKRFKQYIKQFFRPLKQNQIDALWQIRCSLLHSFGLFDPRHTKSIVVDETYPSRAVSETKKTLTLHYKTLYDEFVTSVSAYNGLLLLDASLGRKFDAMAGKYAYLKIDGSIK